MVINYFISIVNLLLWEYIGEKKTTSLTEQAGPFLTQSRCTDIFLWLEQMQTQTVASH